MRVVALACSNTETTCALGCAEMLVGVDDHSDRPAEVVSRLPRVGPDLHVDIAKVASLQPDLVLASLTVPGHETVVDGLDRAGLPYLVLEPVGLDDIYANIRQIGEVLGAIDRGEALVKEMQARLQAVEAPPNRPILLIQWWNRPTIAPGKLSWVTDLVNLAGGRNPLGDEVVKSRPLTDEDVAALDPDAIILSWCGVSPEKYRPDVIYRNPAWQDVTALRRKQVYCVPEAYLGRPGPGLVEGFDALKRIVEKLQAHRRPA